MSKVATPLSPVEVKNEFTAALRRTALRPTIFGYKPQPQQEKFHRSSARGRLAIGGNRSGKTTGGGSETVMRMTGNHPWNNKFKPPVRMRAIGVDFDNGVNKIMMPEIARWMPTSELINGSWEKSYSKGDRTLTIANGSTLEFMSYDQDVDKFAGTSRHGIWFDEEPPEEIFNENLLRLVDVGGDWWITMTPLIDMSWTLDRLFVPGSTGLDPNLEVFEFLTTDNVYVNSSEIAILTMGMDKDQREARTSGKYATYSGAIYSDVIRKDTYIDPIIFTDEWPLYVEQWGHFCMMDHGFRNPTAMLFGCFNHDGKIIIYDEYYESGGIVKENAKAIKKQIHGLDIASQIEYMVADPHINDVDPIAGGSIRGAYAEEGLYFAMANNDVKAGIERVSSRFKTKQLLITKNCTKLKWELERYRWKKHLNSKVAARNNVLEEPLKKDDHACDALRYGVVSRPSLPGEIEMRVGNIINAPVAIEDPDDLKDVALLIRGADGLERGRIFNPYLGDDY